MEGLSSREREIRALSHEIMARKSALNLLHLLEPGAERELVRQRLRREYYRYAFELAEKRRGVGCCASKTP